MSEADDLSRRLVGQEKALPVSKLGRLWKSGRSAAGLAATMLRRRDGMVDVGSLEALTTRLGELKGVGMKMGQILSFIDPSMPPEMRRVLGVLQRSAPASEAGAVRQVVLGAFGARGHELLAAMEPSPFSVASIGQVHRARLPDWGSVAVKVRHPGIEAALAADFSLAGSGVGLANAVTFGMAEGAKGMIEEGRATFLAECDFTREAAHQRTFRRWLSSSGSVVVPEVIDAWSEKTVLTSRFEEGLTLDAFIATAPSQAARNRAGEALFEVMVGGFHRLGLLYADPHPGNFAFRDGQVVVYDFGCVKRFEPPLTRAFSQLTTALRAGRRDDVLASARAFGFGIEGAEREALFERFAKSFFAPLLREGRSVIPPDGAIEASQMIRDKRALAKLGLPPHLLFLLRLRFGLYAVLSALGARADWGALEGAYAQAGPADAASR